MKRYFLHLQYYATGEGCMHSLGCVVASNSDEAIENFLRKTVLSHLPEEKITKEVVDYYTQSVAVYDSTVEAQRKTLESILDNYFSKLMVKTIIETNKDGVLMELFFHYYYNCS
jgi:hypothetical protein